MERYKPQDKNSVSWTCGECSFFNDDDGNNVAECGLNGSIVVSVVPCCKHFQIRKTIPLATPSSNGATKKSTGSAASSASKPSTSGSTKTSTKCSPWKSFVLYALWGIVFAFIAHILWGIFFPSFITSFANVLMLFGCNIIGMVIGGCICKKWNVSDKPTAFACMMVSGIIWSLVCGWLALLVSPVVAWLGVFMKEHIIISIAFVLYALLIAVLEIFIIYSWYNKGDPNSMFGAARVKRNSLNTPGELLVCLEAATFLFTLMFIGYLFLCAYHPVASAVVAFFFFLVMLAD